MGNTHSTGAARATRTILARLTYTKGRDANITLTLPVYPCTGQNDWRQGVAA